MSENQLFNSTLYIIFISLNYLHKKACISTYDTGFFKINRNLYHLCEETITMTLIKILFTFTRTILVKKNITAKYYFNLKEILSPYFF